MPWSGGTANQTRTAKTPTEGSYDMRTSIKIRAVLALGALSGIVWAGTFAAFSDTGTADATFSAGTVDLLISNTASDAYNFTSLSTSNMKPTDVAYAPLTMKNNGSLNFT